MPMIANVFGCHKISTRHEAAIGCAILNFETRSGHRACHPKKFVPRNPKVKAEDRVLDFIRKNAGCTRAEIVSALKMHPNTVANVLSRNLRAKRLTTRRDKKIGKALYSQYWMADGKGRACQVAPGDF